MKEISYQDALYNYARKKAEVNGNAVNEEALESAYEISDEDAEAFWALLGERVRIMNKFYNELSAKVGVREEFLRCRK